MSGPGATEPGTGDAPGVIPHVGHIAALDGLRGLAILAVMLYHQAGFLDPRTPAEWAVADVLGQGGAGVDLFFVISGFLITGILVESRGAAHYYRNFYARRSLRIFPLYYAVLFAAFVLMPRLAPSMIKAKWSHAMGWNQVWYWTYLSNWFIALKTDGPSHGLVDLSWSLSIEEQFYLVWPWVVAMCSRKSLLWACLALAILGPAFRLAVVLAGAPLTWAAFLTPSRFDALGVGAGLALLAREGRDLSRLRPWAWAAFPAGLAATASLAIGHHSSRAWFADLAVALGPTALAALFGAGLILVTSAAPASVAGRVFGGGPLAVLGKYSYALYLFHNPIQAAIRDRVISVPALAGMGLGSLGGQAVFSVIATAPALACAWLSWRLFEAPILGLKRYFPSGRGRSAIDRPAPPPAMVAEGSR